jgi:drug/metabolite transporter (DMT)-like permease
MWRASNWLTGRGNGTCASHPSISFHRDPVGGQFLLHEGLGFASATVGSLTAASSVVSAAALGALLLGEPLTITMLLGGSVLLAGVALAARAAS